MVSVTNASFTLNYRFFHHENCDGNDRGAIDLTTKQQLVYSESMCNSSVPNVGCVNDADGNGSTFKGCYENLEDIPLAAVVEVYYSKCNDCSCDIFAAVITDSSVCRGTTRATTITYCSSESTVVQRNYHSSGMCAGDFFDTESESGCKQTGPTQSTKTVCVGPTGLNPPPPMLETSGASRLGFF